MEIASILRRDGFRVAMSPRSGAGAIKDDLQVWIGGRHFSVECKRRKKLLVYKWLEQGGADCVIALADPSRYHSIPRKPVFMMEIGSPLWDRFVEKLK